MGHKVVWITGCASGVGLYLADQFAKKGYRVVASDINYQALKAAASERNWNSQTVMVRKLDVRKEAQWRKLLVDVLAKWQQLDIMLNVAGYLKPGNISELDAVEIDKHIDINTKGLILGSKVAAEIMIQQKRGHIINIASLAGIAPIPGIALYSSSKFAVRGFSLALAQELKPKGVSVSVVCPDAIETPMLTLQEDYEEAAMTFSGNKALTVEDIGHQIFNKVIPKKPVEVTIPFSRGFVAKLGGALPQVAFFLGELLTRQGKKEQQRRKALLKNTRH